MLVRVGLSNCLLSMSDIFEFRQIATLLELTREMDAYLLASFLTILGRFDTSR